ncbi:MAG: hypothetical protein WBB23_11440 [Desulforhopalus sp.]
MKKFMIALAALLLMFTYGCGADEEQETTENETVIQSQERAAEMRGEEAEEEIEESDDTVKETNKRPVIEGC